MAEKIGWGGRIRTFTVLINSEVSYQLDHAPAVWAERRKCVPSSTIVVTRVQGDSGPTDARHRVH